MCYAWDCHLKPAWKLHLVQSAAALLMMEMRLGDSVSLLEHLH